MVHMTRRLPHFTFAFLQTSHVLPFVAKVLWLPWTRSSRMRIAVVAATQMAAIAIITWAASFVTAAAPIGHQLAPMHLFH